MGGIGGVLPCAALFASATDLKSWIVPELSL
jgi:hypothetical protein